VQGPQTAFAASACRASGPVTAEMGKNNSGSACRHVPRDIQLRERDPDITGSTASRLPPSAGAVVGGEGSRALGHG